MMIIIIIIIIIIIMRTTYQDNTLWIKIRSQDHTNSSPTISQLGHNLLTSLYPQNTTLVQQDTRTCESYAVTSLPLIPHALSLQIAVADTETDHSGIKNLHFTDRACQFFSILKIFLSYFTDRAFQFFTILKIFFLILPTERVSSLAFSKFSFLFYRQSVSVL